MLFRFVTFFLVFAFCGSSIHAEDNVSFPLKREYFSMSLDRSIEQGHCRLSDQNKQGIINVLTNRAKYLSKIGDITNLNIASERNRKRKQEKIMQYNPQWYPYQESAYRLAVIYSGRACEEINYSLAMLYYSKAGHKAESYYGAAILNVRYYKITNDKDLLDKAVDLFILSGHMGIKQGYLNAIYILDHIFPDRFLQSSNVRSYYMKIN